MATESVKRKEVIEVIEVIETGTGSEDLDLKIEKIRRDTRREVMVRNLGRESATGSAEEGRGP